MARSRTKCLNINERFWEKVDTSKNCWEWVASKRNKDNYGGFRFRNQIWLSHRVSWVLINGEIPRDICVLHTCDNPLCVNPEHLFLGTHNDNMKDRNQKNRQAKIKKSYCPQGHPYSGDNLYVNPNNGNRKCKTCNKIQQRKYRGVLK